MEYERSLVKKFKDLPIQILGINLDPDREKAQARCEKDGITWPSLHVDWDEITEITGSGIPQFFLLDANGIVRFQTTGGGGNFQVTFMKEAEKLLKEMGHSADLVSHATAEKSVFNYKPYLATGSSRILDRIKNNGKLDDSFLKELVPQNWHPGNQQEILSLLKSMRCLMTVQMDHPDSRDYLRSLLEDGDSSSLNTTAWELFKFSEEFSLGDDVTETCLEISKKGCTLDETASSLDTYAHWLSRFEYEIDAAIKLEERAIQIATKEMNSLKQKKDVKQKIQTLEKEISFYQSFIAELKQR